MHRPSLFIGKKHFNCEEALRYNVQREPGGTGIKANTVDDYYKINIHIPGTRVAGLLSSTFCSFICFRVIRLSWHGGFPFFFLFLFFV